MYHLPSFGHISSKINAKMQICKKCKNVKMQNTVHFFWVYFFLSVLSSFFFVLFHFGLHNHQIKDYVLHQLFVLVFIFVFIYFLLFGFHTLLQLATPNFYNKLLFLPEFDITNCFIRGRYLHMRVRIAAGTWTSISWRLFSSLNPLIKQRWTGEIRLRYWCSNKLHWRISR